MRILDAGSLTSRVYFLLAVANSSPTRYQRGFFGQRFMKFSIYIALAASLGFAGCASVTRGTSEKVVVTSDPADANIRTSLGHSCPQSPCTVEVSRKVEFTAYAEKNGYKPGSHFIRTKLAGNGAAGLAGNILLGGIVGMGVDAATGATLDHYPNPAHIYLAPRNSAKESTNISNPPQSKNIEITSSSDN